MNEHCSKCSAFKPERRYIPFSVEISEGRIFQAHTTVSACCEAKLLHPILDLRTDYGWKEIKGERFYGETQQLIKLCNAIGKSPFSIRHGVHGGYFIEVQAKHMLSKLATLSLIASALPEKELDG